MTRVFDINEITMSAYIQADGELTIFGRPLRLQAGVRYTDVDTDVTFTDRYSLVTTRGSSGTWKFLPSGTAIFDVTAQPRLRFKLGRAAWREKGGQDVSIWVGR